MKNFIFIMSLCGSISISTLLPMKRLADSSCTKKIAYSLMTQEPNELFELYPNFYPQTEVEPWDFFTEDTDQPNHTIDYLASTIKPTSTKNKRSKKYYICTYEECGKSFKTKSHLDNHIRTHTGEKPYICSYKGCGKSCTQNSNLRSHMHIHTDKKPYICSFERCGKSFAYPSVLKNHMRTHTNEKPYICTYCDKAFTHSTHLKTHLRIHTGEKSYFCTIEGCNKTFTDQSNYKKHIRTKHNNQMRIKKDNSYENYESKLIFERGS